MGTASAWPAFSFQTPSSGALIFYGQFKTDPVHIYATADGGVTWEASVGHHGLGRDHARLVRAQGTTGHIGANPPVVGPQTTQRRPAVAGCRPDLNQTTDPGRQRFPGPCGAMTAGGSSWPSTLTALHPSMTGSTRAATMGGRGSSRRTWLARARLDPRPRPAAMPSSSTSEWILIAGDGSSVASTVDGGAHWRTVVGSLAFNIGSSSFASPDVGWAVALCGPHEYPPTHPACDPTGVKRLLLQTTDGGRTWTPVGEKPGELLMSGLPRLAVRVARRKHAAELVALIPALLLAGCSVAPSPAGSVAAAGTAFQSPVSTAVARSATPTVAQSSSAPVTDSPLAAN